MTRITLLLICFVCLFHEPGFSQSVNRIISLVPSITENIYLLNAEKKLVGCASQCTPAVKDKKQTVGSAMEVNVEKIFTLQPDLVLAMELTKPQDIETMKKLGIRIVLMPTPKNFDEVCAQFIQISGYVGEKEYAKEIVVKEQQKVDSLKKEITEQEGEPLKYFFQIGVKPIFTVLSNTFMDDFIHYSGGENIAADFKRGTITREAVLLRNPDIILIATMELNGEKERNNWLKYRELEAAKNKKIFLIDSNIACLPTPVNFRKTMEEIVRFLGKECMNNHQNPR